MTPSIAALDVPLAQVESEMAALVARQKRQVAEAAERERRIRRGVRAEQRHLLLDPDPDSVTPRFADLTKHFAGGSR